ncbi:N-acetylglucosamine-6-phosphate deacetylase [Oceanobacillus halotolerans]|uniref:N-acetylglucosamine-6-phosphate deacetylase n=1 Tax=Oceanobacillus halotolerans TaxID=2663380 RepID=UPI0013DD50CC|nr:N-acetylglucosamine-6-phosphate deacetylase [Oceanobacillus halotolerans]
MDNKLLIKGLTIFAENNVIKDGYIKISGNLIKEVGSVMKLDPGSVTGYTEMEFPKSYSLIPGFIDLHIHGAGGADVMDGTNEALSIMTSTLPKEGTTSFLPTTITQHDDVIEAAIKNVSQYVKGENNTPGQAEILGVHLEGPFISPKRSGAQPTDFIDDPDITVFKRWQEQVNDLIKLVTLAPEEDSDHQLTKYLKRTGVIASIGHSDASYNQVEDAIDAGITHVTHLFNQMRGLHHREPGVVGAAFLKEELMTELIVDGIHVAPEMVNLSYQQIGKDRLVLITDAMRAKCLKNGMYDLGGQSVTVQDGKATLEDGTLAGSVLQMNHAVKNMLSYSETTLGELIQMTSINPAKELQLFDRKGSIKRNKDADLVVLDENFDVVLTICRGQLAYQKKEVL